MSTLPPQPVPMERDLDGVARAALGDPAARLAALATLTALVAATDRGLAADVIEPAPYLATLPPPVD